MTEHVDLEAAKKTEDLIMTTKSNKRLVIIIEDESEFFEDMTAEELAYNLLSAWDEYSPPKFEAHWELKE